MKIILQYPDAQYAHQKKKGDSVKHWSGIYRVQEDKGWKHIIVTKTGRREKIGIDKFMFDPGSLQDYIFNGWHQHYSWPEYQQFVMAEMNWLK